MVADSPSRQGGELAALRAQVALLDAQRARLGRLAETMNGLSALSLQINTLDADQIKNLCITRVPALLRARSAALFGFDANAGELVLERHTEPALLERPLRLAPGTDTLLARAVASQEVIAVHDLEAYAQGLEGPLLQCPALVGTQHACLLAPLRSAQVLMGVLVLMDREDGGAFDAVNDLPSLQQLGLLLGAALRNLQLYDQVVTQSRTDALTGVLNRRALWERLALEIQRAGRYGRPLSVLMVDLDHFKRINDVHGHREGDAALLAVSGVLLRQLRAVDVVGRYGGDEFSAVLPETDAAGAQVVGQRILAQVRALGMPSGAKLTCSIGVGALAGKMTPEDLLGAADKALYAAKAAGRDALSAG